MPAQKVSYFHHHSYLDTLRDLRIRESEAFRVLHVCLGLLLHVDVRQYTRETAQVAYPFLFHGAEFEPGALIVPDFEGMALDMGDPAYHIHEEALLQAKRIEIFLTCKAGFSPSALLAADYTFFTEGKDANMIRHGALYVIQGEAGLVAWGVLSPNPCNKRAAS